MFRLIAIFLGVLPLNAISRAAGRLANARIPGALLHPVIRLFGRVVGVDFSEAMLPVESFRSFQDFFTRELRDGARPLDPGPDSFLSPCDGAWGAAGRIEQGQILQVKGRPYSLAALLGNESEAKAFEGGQFATLYLSPRDYHRFHAPAQVEVVATRHLPGRLWPVNRIGLEGVDGLFADNERICARMRFVSSQDVGMCLVAVGATIVGSVKLTFDSLTTNEAGAVAAMRDYDPPIALARGEEWGRFEFGSTIVVLVRPGAAVLEEKPAGTPLRLGERIGVVSSSAPTAG